MAGRMVYTKLNPSSCVRIHAPAPQCPIVIVPGIMGSRLTDPKSGDMAWNPTGWPLGDSPGMFKVDPDRLQQLGAELVADETHGFDKDSDNDDVAHIRHFRNLVSDFYGDLAKSLSKTDWLDTDDPKYGVKPRVYCCGYDWRQDNAKSALRLAAVVEEALVETRAKKVFIVAHSMGGLVSRYYCRVLGGESKVAALILIGSPSQGAPSAYMQLKHGIPAIYAGDMKNDILVGEDDVGTSSGGKTKADSATKKAATADLVDNAITAAGAATTAIETIAMGGSVGDAIGEFLGKIYLALCIGAGRMLKRDETIYFCRQMPSAYQLLPNSTYCRDNKNWILFDPLSTGCPPTGFLIKLPSITDVTTFLAEQAIAAANQQKADDFKNAVDSFTSPDAPDSPNDRLLSANATDLADMVAQVKAVMGDDDSAKSDAEAKLAVIGKAFGDRVKKTFMDCRNNEALYTDIFVGFQDRLDMRGLSSQNLALALRFDEALRMKPTPEDTLAAKDLLVGLFKGIATPFILLGQVIADSGKNWDANRAKRKADEAADKAKADAAEAEKKKGNWLYMHPKTVCLYGDHRPTNGGCLLAALETVSTYDANQVRWQMIPNPIPAMGDGTVPKESAFPSDDIVPPNTIDRAKSQCFQGVEHAAMASNGSIVSAVKDAIKAYRGIWWSV